LIDRAVAGAKNQTSSLDEVVMFASAYMGRKRGGIVPKVLTRPGCFSSNTLKAAILRGSHKTVILSEAPRGSIA
jgi:hypothetical protein